MKKTLRPNEEQQGLKLIQINDGFVVVDLNKKPVIGDICIGSLNSEKDTIFKVCRLAKIGLKIIFATCNLNLEGVPEIEDKVNELASKEYPFAFGGIGNMENDRKNHWIKGYKQAQQNLFTEEDMRACWQKAFEQSFEKWIKNKEPKKFKDFLKSLKQPKVEIEFSENGEPIKCVLC